MRKATWRGATLIACAVCGAAFGQTMASSDAPAWLSNVVVPQTRIFQNTGGAVLTRVEADIDVVQRLAATTLTIHLSNPTSRRVEAVLLAPVPDGAVVKAFSFQGATAGAEARLLPIEEARSAYRTIVARELDPALLEFAGSNLVRSSVFPVEPQGTQQVRLTYEHLLPADGSRVDYVLPRSESLEYRVPWSIAVRVSADDPVSTVYSPSHDLAIERLGPSALRGAVRSDGPLAPGPFRFSYVRQEGDISGTIFVTPAAQRDGGHFLLLAGLPAELAPEAPREPQPREVTLVLDRSGSMNGEKMEQVREAAKQVIAGLDPGEPFNVFVYNEGVDRFAEAPVAKTADTEAEARRYLDSVRPRGGTNIHDALAQALAQPLSRSDALPIVLFLTDGLPTIGQTSEPAIRDVARSANPHARRIFTFGVGVDVNSPLLEKIASESRATATFVLPQEDVEVKVGQVFRKLSGPVLTDPVLAAIDEAGAPTPGRVRDVIPMRLPDLFDGDQLVVLGEYLGEAPPRFRLSGNCLGQPKEAVLAAKRDAPAGGYAFVPRLWASRKIAALIDAIREMGGDVRPGVSPASVQADPRFAELVGEIVRLSREYGILTEYTAFLAEEGVDLHDEALVEGRAASYLGARAAGVRSGLSAFNQEANQVQMKVQSRLNPMNSFYDAEMNLREVRGVQQMNDLAFYRRGEAWVDSRVAKRSSVQPDREVAFGSPEFFALAERLVQTNRQGAVALRGDILLEVDGEVVLVRGPRNP